MVNGPSPTPATPDRPANSRGPATGQPLIELNWSKCALQPFAHQRAGVRALVTRPYFALLDEPGAGKTKQVIDPACFLYEADCIDAVLVICPASVRAVWAGEFGEIDKHAFVPSAISEFHTRTPQINSAPGVLNWYVTNYEFIRMPNRLESLIKQLAGQRVMVVLDESIRIKSPKAASTKAVLKIAKLALAARRVILNGTPIGNNPLDLWAQFEFLDPAILGVKNYTHMKARYAVMGGYRVGGRPVQVIGWQRLEDLQQRIAPHCLRRLKVDCLDLPDKTYTVREKALDEPNWRLYRQMRDECVAWLDQQTASVAPQTIVRIMRLAQITAGFIGGLDASSGVLADSVADGLGVDRVQFGVRGQDVDTPRSLAPREIGREKLDVFLELLEEMLAEDPALHLLVWCRFRAELDRLARVIGEKFSGVFVNRIQGGQKEDDRRAAVNRFQERRPQPYVLLGNPQAGGLGLTLTAAHRVVYMSNDYNLVTRLQSEDRVHRPGQVNRVLYTDIVACGPDGQRTIDHVVLNALRKKQDLASWTTDAWRRELSE
jgi:SNF2 family DNA or RNA helicase